MIEQTNRVLEHWELDIWESALDHLEAVAKEAVPKSLSTRVIEAYLTNDSHAIMALALEIGKLER